MAEYICAKCRRYFIRDHNDPYTSAHLREKGDPPPQLLLYYCDGCFNNMTVVRATS